MTALLIAGWLIGAVAGIWYEMHALSAARVLREAIYAQNLNGGRRAVNAAQVRGAAIGVAMNCAYLFIGAVVIFFARVDYVAFSVPLILLFGMWANNFRSFLGGRMFDDIAAMEEARTRDS